MKMDLNEIFRIYDIALNPARTPTSIAYIRTSRVMDRIIGVAAKDCMTAESLSMTGKYVGPV